jgi:hypothetical protein
MGQSKVQAVKDADAGCSKNQPGKENESGLVSSLERCLKGYKNVEQEEPYEARVSRTVL